MRSLRAKACAASVPTEMVQFIVGAGKIHLTNELAIFGGTRLEVNHTHGVAMSIVTDVEERDVGEAFWRGLHCHPRRRIEGWVRTHQRHTYSPCLGVRFGETCRPVFCNQRCGIHAGVGCPNWRTHRS